MLVTVDWLAQALVSCAALSQDRARYWDLAGHEGGDDRPDDRAVLTILYYRRFDNVVQIVAERVAAIPRQQNVMMWHHVYLRAFALLDFERQ